MYVQIICNRLFPIFLPQGPFIKPCLGGFSDSHEHMLKPIEMAMLNNQMVSVQPPDGLNPYGLMVCLRWFSVESLS